MSTNVYCRQLERLVEFCYSVVEEKTILKIKNILKFGTYSYIQFVTNSE